MMHGKHSFAKLQFFLSGLKNVLKSEKKMLCVTQAYTRSFMACHTRLSEGTCVTEIQHNPADYSSSALVKFIRHVANR